VIGLADRAGSHISFRQFARFGAPMTAITLLIASAFVALHIYVGPRPTLLGGSFGLVLYGLGSRWIRRTPSPVPSL